MNQNPESSGAAISCPHCGAPFGPEDLAALAEQIAGSGQDASSPAGNPQDPAAQATMLDELNKGLGYKE